MKNQFKKNLKKELQERFPEAEIQEKEVSKNNETLEAFLLVTESRNIAPTIYIEPMYMMFQRFLSEEVGVSIEELSDAAFQFHEKQFFTGICDRLKLQIEKCGHMNTLAEKITEFDKVKNKLYVRIVKKTDNEEYVNKHCHRDFLDLAIIPGIRFGTTDGQASIYLTKDIIEKWGKSEDEVIDLGIANIEDDFMIRSMRDMMSDMFDMCDEYVDELNLVPFYVVTNKAMLNGASAILSKKALKQMELTLGDEFIIIPSSVHECLCIKAGDDNTDFINEMINEVNSTQVDPQDVLSNHMYIYKKGEIFIQ